MSYLGWPKEYQYINSVDFKTKSYAFARLSFATKEIGNTKEPFFVYHHLAINKHQVISINMSQIISNSLLNFCKRTTYMDFSNYSKLELLFYYIRIFRNSAFRGALPHYNLRTIQSIAIDDTSNDTFARLELAEEIGGRTKILLFYLKDEATISNEIHAENGREIAQFIERANLSILTGEERQQ